MPHFTKPGPFRNRYRQTYDNFWVYLIVILTTMTVTLGTNNVTCIVTDATALQVSVFLIRSESYLVNIERFVGSALFNAGLTDRK